MQLNLNTPELLRLNWPHLTPEQIADLETEGVIRKQIQHNTNLLGQGDAYTGTVQARAIWVHAETLEQLAEAHPWQSVAVLPAHIFAALATGISLSTEAQTLLATVNGGAMPPIMPPPEEEPETPPTETGDD